MLLNCLPAARARAEAGRVTPLMRQTGRGRRRFVVPVGGRVPQRLVCELASSPDRIDMSNVYVIVLPIY